MPEDASPYDVFFSYARVDAERAAPLIDALEAIGLAVFVDDRKVDEFQSIAGTITGALGRSRALVALYSATYPLRRACQFELTTAFLAAQRSGDPRRRVLVVNPEASVEHIQPIELRETRFAVGPAPGDAESSTRVAESISRHLDQVEGLLGEIETREETRWFPTSAKRSRRAASPRFVGRAPALWEIHSALQPFHLSAIAGATESGTGAAQIRGLGGIGKTFLAQEYAVRFGPAYPGGVFWLEAGGENVAEESDETAGTRGRDLQLRELADALDPELEEDATPAEVERSLAREIERRALPCLWIVDDVSPGLTAEQLRQWWSPHPLARTLVTTRSREYGAFATVVEPGVLDPGEALDLLTMTRKPVDPDERREARELAAVLGHHALALDVARAALKYYGPRPFAEFRAGLAAPTEDELAVAADDLKEVLPTGHEASITSTILRSIQRLDPDGRDLLRLASVFAAAPIPYELMDAVLADAAGDDPGVAPRRGRRARSEVDALSLSEPAGEAALTVHPLILRVLRFSETQPPESLRAAAVRVLNTTLPTEIDPRRRWELRERVTHARTVSAQCENLDEARLIGRVAAYDLETGDSASAAALYRKQVEAYGRLLDHNAAETRLARSALARSLQASGDPASASEIRIGLIDELRKERGRTHPDTLAEMTALASSKREEGELAAARELNEEVLDAARALFGEHDDRTLTAMNNLALTKFAQGEVSPARELQATVVAQLRRSLGEAHLDTLGAMNNLAEMLRAEGDLSTALDFQRLVAGGFADVYGDDHPRTIVTVNNLAIMLFDAGELEEARALQQRVCVSTRRRFGADHPKTLATMDSLAATLQALGRHRRARFLRESAREGSRRTLGEEHPLTLARSAMLLETLESLDDVAAAIEVTQGFVETALDHPSLLLGLAPAMLQRVFATAPRQTSSERERARIAVVDGVSREVASVGERAAALCSALRRQRVDGMAEVLRAAFAEGAVERRSAAPAMEIEREHVLDTLSSGLRRGGWDELADVVRRVRPEPTDTADAPAAVEEPALPYELVHGPPLPPYRWTAGVHSGSIWLLALAERSGAQPIVLSAGADGAIRSLRLDGTPAEFQVARAADAAIWSLVVAGPEQLVISGDAGGAIRIWGLEGGSGPLQIDEDLAGVGALALTRQEGKALLVSGHRDGAIRSWSLDGTPGPLQLADAHDAPVTALIAVLHEQQPLVVSADGTGAMRSWWPDGATGRGASGPLVVDEAHGDEIAVLALAEPDGLVLSGGRGGELRSWHLDGRPGPLQLEGAHAGLIWALAVVRHGDRSLVVTAGDDGAIRSWWLDGAPGPFQVPRAHVGSIGAILATEQAGRKLLVSGGRDGTVACWPLDPASALNLVDASEDEAVDALAVAEGEPPLVVAATGAGALRSWRLDGTPGHLDRDGAHARPAPDSESGGVAIPALALAGEGMGQRLFSGGADGALRSWTLDGAPGGFEIERAHAVSVFGASLPCPIAALVVAEQDGRLLLVSADSSEGDVHSWWLDGSVGSLQLPQEDVAAVDSQDVRAQLLAMLAQATGRSRPTVPLRALTVIRDGSRELLVTGGEDGAVRSFWLDGSTGPLQVDRAHAAAVRALTIVERPEPIVISAGADGAIRSWRLDGDLGPLQIRWAHGAPVLALARSGERESAVVASGAQDGSIHTWLLDGSLGPIQLRQPHRGPISGLVACEDAGHRLLVSAGRDGVILKHHLDRLERGA